MKKTVFLFLIGIVALSSCSSRKKTVTPSQPQAFEWMTSNLSIQVEGNGMAYDDLSGQIRIRRDSLVWLSVTATLGVEVLRAKVSADSAWVVNRLEKRYLAEPLDTLSAQLGMPISLPWLQAMLLDNNEGLAPVENQTVLLKTFVMGNWTAKIRYKNINLDEKTNFPLKITDKMERFRLQR